VPPVIVRLPLPEMTPVKVSTPPVILRPCAPSTTEPEPPSEMISTGSLAAEMSKVPLFCTLFESRIVPVPDKARAAPALMVVAPE